MKLAWLPNMYGENALNLFLNRLRDRFFLLLVSISFVFLLVLGFSVATAEAVRAPDYRDYHAVSRLSQSQAQTAKPQKMLRRKDKRTRRSDFVVRKIKDLDLLNKDLSPSLSTEDEIVSGLLQNLKGSPWGKGLKVKDLKLKHVGKSHDVHGVADLFYVTFVQEKSGYEIEDTYVRFTVRHVPGNNKIVSAQAKICPVIPLNKAPKKKLKKVKLREKAAKALGLDHKRVKLKKEKKRLRYIEGKWREVNEFRFKESFYNGVVDEETGESWAEDDRLFGTIQGQVQGQGILFDPWSATLDILTLSDLEVSASGVTNYTDMNGFYNLSNQNAQTTLTAELKGRWVDVNDYAQLDLNFSTTASSDDIVNIFFNSAGGDENSIAQVNAYYHTDFIHDFLEPYLSDPTPLNDFTGDGIDDPIPTYTNIASTCNAFYTSNAINFYASGEGCPNTAFDTIIYHEYGHFIDSVYGGIPSGGLSEGWGDLIAILTTNQSEVGEGFFGPGMTLRTGDNNYQWNSNHFPHTEGQAWSGFGWHLKENLEVTLGDSTQALNLTRNLIIPTIEANAVDIPSAVYEVAIRDDDDGDLNNGTPYFLEIINAANQHSIPSQFPFISISTPLENDSFSQGIGSISIAGTASGLNFLSYQLFCGVEKIPTNWIPITAPITTSVTNSALGTWDVSGMGDGIYTIKLVVNWSSGESFFQTTNVVLVNEVPVQITNDPVKQWGPDISNNVIVWNDYRHGTFTPAIYMYDLITGQEQRISVSTHPQFNPTISGDKIVWVDLRPGGTDLYLYDLTLNQEQRLSTGLNGPFRPHISGDRIVWHDQRNGNSDVFMYDLLTTQEIQITNELIAQEFPKISSDYIVWREQRLGVTVPFFVYDLVSYDHSTGQKLTLSTESLFGFTPDIEGDRVVWHEFRDRSYDVFLYDFITGQEQQINTDSFDQENPVISGNYIVWLERYNNNYNIYLFDLIIGREYLIQNNVPSGTKLALDGDTIVWHENGSSGELDIYMKKFDPANYNQLPVLNQIPGRCVNQGGSPTFTFTASDPDVGDRLTFSVQSTPTLPAGYNFDTNLGQLSWPSTAPLGTWNVTVTATDTGALSDSKSFNINVKAQCSQCFILTATYGLPFPEELDVLKEFREQVIEKYTAGRWAMNQYYKYGPGMAAVVAQHEWMKRSVRAAVQPAIWFAEWYLDK